jgi:hypothetical protein
MGAGVSVETRAKTRGSRPTKVTQQQEIPADAACFGRSVPAANLDAMMKHRKELQEVRSLPPCCLSSAVLINRALHGLQPGEIVFD